MFLLPKKTSYLGVDTFSSSYKTVIVKRKGKGFEVSHLKESPKEDNVNPLYNLPKDPVVCTSLPSSDVLVKFLEFPIKKVKNALDALNFQIEPQLPFPMEEALVQSELFEKKAASTSLTAYVVKKDRMKKFLSQLSFDPEIVSSVPHALSSFSGLLPKTPSAHFIVHASETEITCALIWRGKLLSTRAFSKSFQAQKEIQKTVLRMGGLYKNYTFENIYLLGESPQLASLIEEETGKKVLFPSSPHLTLSPQELMRFGLSIGIALSSAHQNFRQKEFSHPAPFKRWKKPLFITGLLFIIFFTSLLYLEKTALFLQKKKMENAYLELIRLEIGKEEGFPDNEEAYRARLDKIQKEIEERPNTFPLLCQVPKVKEVLAWLSEPLAAGRSEIDVHLFHYSMVKRPDFSNRTHRYKVKVELELNADNPTAARKFHDFLMSDNPFVDLKEEFTWTASKGKYRVDFFLKDRTRYN